MVIAKELRKEEEDRPLSLEPAAPMRFVAFSRKISSHDPLSFPASYLLGSAEPTPFPYFILMPGVEKTSKLNTLYLPRKASVEHFEKCEVEPIWPWEHISVESCGNIE